MNITNICFKLILRYVDQYKPPKHNTKYWGWRKYNKNKVLMYMFLKETIFKMLSPSHSFILNAVAVNRKT